MPGANILGVAYRGKQNLYAENNGWADIYFFELRKRFSTKTNYFSEICRRWLEYIHNIRYGVEVLKTDKVDTVQLTPSLFLHNFG